MTGGTASSSSQRPRGPRRQGDARQDIVLAARRLFAERGFAGTSMRAVAREAGVDPALVHHYFDGKPHLFGESAGLSLDATAFVGRVVAAGQDAPEELLRTFVLAWEQVGARERIMSVLANVGTRPEAVEAFREFVAGTVLGPIAAGLGLDDAERRVALVASQLVGLSIVRYVVRLEPLASAGIEALVADVVPTLRRYLFEELDGVAAHGS